MSDQRESTQDLANSIEAYQNAIASSDNEAATAAMHTLFAAAAQAALDNPTLATKLHLVAKDLESQGKWEAASDVYRNILSIEDLDALAETQAHENLGMIAWWMNRDEESREHAHRATASARRSEVLILLSICLQREAGCMIRCGQIEDAINRLEESVALLDDSPMHAPSRAGALTQRAKCAVKQGALADADVYLKEALELLEPSAKIAMAAGIQGNVARCWSVRGQLQTARGDHEAALNSWRKAVEITRQIADLPHVEESQAKTSLADMLEGLARVLAVADLEAERHAVLEERQKALEAVGLPDYQSNV